LHERRREGCELCASSFSTNIMPNLLSSFSSLINTTVLRFKISFTRKRCTSILRFHSRDPFVVSSAVNAQFCVHVGIYFGRTWLDLSHTIDRLKFQLTSSLISQFLTTFVLHLFPRSYCIDAAITRTLYFVSSVLCLRALLFVPFDADVVPLGLLARILLHWSRLRCRSSWPPLSRPTAPMLP
jgi:hypothetical protein